MKRIGIALGGGGAKGLAHLPMLEVLDELDVRPARIAGTSIGAIVGALYASGRPASKMRAGVEELTGGDASTLQNVFGGSLKWLSLLSVEWQKGGLIDTQGFLDKLHTTVGGDTFEQLEIPLSVVATDFWTREQVVFESGELVPAVRASMALPGVFRPVVRDGRVLVDGGSVNPVPFDLLQDDCDVTVAIDVLGHRVPGEEAALPSLGEAMFQTYTIMEASIVRAKRERRPPTIYLEPRIEDVRALEFNKAEQIFEQAQPERERLRRELAALL